METEHVITGSKYDPSTYYLGKETWQVGPRYRLKKYLGAGSFSRVCLAFDTRTGQDVALKKVSDVGKNLNNARKVLREVCILRRLKHPHIVRLHDVFWKPSPTGRFSFVNGELQSSSLDVYFALEYCAAGDLHALKGQMSPGQIQVLLAQALAAVRYMHALNVWHRDLKSANLLLTVHEGQAAVKVADLGSARSGTLPSAQLRRSPSGVHAEAGVPGERPCVHFAAQTRDSIINEPAGIAMLPCNQECVTAAQGPQAGLLTMAVCTPCYRAPEVVIARGRYGASMDMWSVGCIFGELLQRTERSGASITPKLSIPPVFKLPADTPRTPPASVDFAHDTSLANMELRAIFDVIGTPEWACIEAVENERWRRYLWHLPAQAPSIMRRFWFAGELAVDLLRRMLAFDPSRRCSADEALSHEYFQGLQVPTAPAERSPAGASCAGAEHSLRLSQAQSWLRQDRAVQGAPEHGCKRHKPLGNAGGRPLAAGKLDTVFNADVGKPGDADAGLGGMAAPAATGLDATAGGQAGQMHARYYDIPEPAAALRALELELDKLMAASDAERSEEVACKALCHLIKLECDAEAKRQQAAAAEACEPQPATARAAHEQTQKAFQSKWSSWNKQHLELDPRSTSTRFGSGDQVMDSVLHSLSLADERSRASTAARATWPVMAAQAASEQLQNAMGRLAPAAAADAVSPSEAQLKPGRHMEWSIHSGRDLIGQDAGPCWGGGLGSGLDSLDMDQATCQVISRQQGR